MKYFILTIFIALLFVDAKAQYPKLIISLKDKSNNSYNINNPSQYLSQRAIQRRTKFNITIDSTDLPVSATYIDSIRMSGDVKILSSSRWLNQVLIATTDPTAINKINSYAFVKSAAPVGNRVFSNLPIDKFKETPIPLSSDNNRPAKTAVDSINYGSNYNQVHIHEGEYLHNKGYLGQTIQITVLDAGFYQYKNISAFDSIRLNNQVLGERDNVAFDNSVNEDDSHGMYCLSIMAANWPGRMVGTAPKANYWLVRTENAASEYPVEEHNWVVGAEFADSTGSDMISSSLGYSTFDDASFNHNQDQLYKNAALVTQGASLAAQKGMIVMNSAGNEGGNSWKYIIFPADADSVCAVGAVNNAGIIAGFSSIGYPQKIKPNIVSVGVRTVIAGTNNQPASGSGTSFANPNVAGLIACLWQAFPAINNMRILDAVYRSSNQYTTPDASYGFGIPNFKIAYQLLKHDQNVEQFGNEWFFATPDPFNSQIDIQFIGRIDGTATAIILNEAGQEVAKQEFTTEKEEFYSYSFTNLENLAPGHYIVRYVDSVTSKDITLQHNNIFWKDWLVVAPNPFRDNVTVYVKAPVTGEISLRIIDAKGSIVETYTATVTEGQSTNFQFKNGAKLAKGAYFVQYIDKTQKKTIALLKN